MSTNLLDNELHIRERVMVANQTLRESGLVNQTWGNASAIDDTKDFIFIKPSGVDFDSLTPQGITKVDLKGHFDGDYKPSVDTPGHLALYRGFENIGGVTHTHSHYATVFAQAKLPIPCLGTTHADYFNGSIPLISNFSEEEIKNDYEENIGKKIVEHFIAKEIAPYQVPAAIVESHGVFTWGKTVEEALENALVVEEVAKLAYQTLLLSDATTGNQAKMNKTLIARHFQRKHGSTRYYGQ